MIAVDTNVVVRFLVGDDPLQTPLANRLFSQNRISIPHTVLLETEWVLRSTYHFTRDRIVAAFLHLLSIETVVCKHVDSVLSAVRAMAEGCDFADALHATTAQSDAEAFVTFDRDFADRAPKRDGILPVRLPTES